MPVCSKKVGKKWRVVECGSSKIAKNKSGSAADGGGHMSKADCVAQVSAINISLRKRGKI